MRIKKKNVARLASLSALGAGALGVTAGTAQAGMVSYPLGATVGFGSSFTNSSAKVNLPGGNFFSVKATSGPIDDGSRFWGVFVRGDGGVYFKKGLSGFLSMVGSSGVKWSQVSGKKVTSASIASRVFKMYWKPDPPSEPVSWSSRYGVHGNPGFSDMYALFTFQDGGSTQYGWLELSNSVSAVSTEAGGGPLVTLESYGYDDASVPEPSTMALTCLAALAMGATGLRRRRAARKPAA